MSTLRAHILVVEDEPAQREVLRYNLEAEGYRVSLAADGDAAQLAIAEAPPDLVLLDWMLPGVSGIELCRRIKRAPATRDIAVIMVSARGEEADRVRGLDTGADDYLSKPFSMAEMLARVRARLRRTRPASVGEVLRRGDIELDPGRHLVRVRGQAVSLRPTEFRLLATFLERPGRVWSRAALLERVWPDAPDLETRTVDVHVGRLRRALARAGCEDPIRTIRGEGYALGE